MKKIITLFLVAIILATTWGCTENTANPATDQDNFTIYLQVVSYDEERKSLQAAELNDPERISYIINDTEAIDLSEYQAGDKIAVVTDAIMESDPAQVNPIAVSMMTEEKTDENATSDPVTYEIIKKIPDEIKDQIQENNETSGHEIIQTDSASYLVVYMGMRNSGGYDIQVTDIQKVGDQYLVQVLETAPGKDMMVTMALTYPYTIVKLNEPLDEKAITIERISQ